MHNDSWPVAAHYGTPDLVERITSGLRAAGLDPARLTTADLAPLDQFHTGGADATRELARIAGVRSGMRVLDLGGGIGGPARTLASEFGCDVTVLDLTEAFCQAGRMLTTATSLDDRVRFHSGDALDPPLEQGSFDVVWTQHSTMNIADKPALYRAARRMLRDDGVLAMHEITAGGNQPVPYPQPWASDGSISHLAAPDDLRRTIEGAGFVARSWSNASPDATDWFRQRLAKRPPHPPPLGLHILLGARFLESFQNLLRGLEDDGLRVVIGAFETRPAHAHASRE